MSLGNLPSEILDEIIDILPKKTKYILRQVSRRFRNFIPLPIRVEIHHNQLIGTLHMTSTVPEGPISDEFLSHHEYSTKSSYKTNVDTKMVSCFRTFDYPPKNKYSIFTSAKIDHFQINEYLPVLLNDENLRHLTNLLRGCIIDHITLVFDDTTLSNLHKIPELVSRLRSQHVDFVLVRFRFSRLLSETMNGELASALYMSGVREVSFSGESFFGNQPRFSFDLILMFFKAGMNCINVNRGALFPHELRNKMVESLIIMLSKLGTVLKLRLNVLMKDDNLKGRSGDIIDGMIVKVSKYNPVYRKYSVRYSIITIECDRVI